MINIVPIVSEGPLNFNSSIDVVRAFFFVYAPFLYLSLSHTHRSINLRAVKPERPLQDHNLLYHYQLKLVDCQTTPVFLIISGYLVRKELELALTSCGEPFSADEMEEMWKAIQSLRLDRGGDRLIPTDGFDYTTFTKFMMK